LLAATIEQGPKGGDFGSCRDTRNQLVDVTGPFEFGGEPIEGRLCTGELGATFREVRLARANLNAAIVELLNISSIETGLQKLATNGTEEVA
jgi:hypothetical protein